MEWSSTAVLALAIALCNQHKMDPHKPARKMKDVEQNWADPLMPAKTFQII